MFETLTRKHDGEKSIMKRFWISILLQFLKYAIASMFSIEILSLKEAHLAQFTFVAPIYSQWRMKEFCSGWNKVAAPPKEGL